MNCGGPLSIELLISSLSFSLDTLKQEFLPSALASQAKASGSWVATTDDYDPYFQLGSDSL